MHDSIQHLSPLPYLSIPICIALHHLYSHILICKPFFYSPIPFWTIVLFRSLYCTTIPIPVSLFLLDSLIWTLCRNRILWISCIQRTTFAPKQRFFIWHFENVWLMRPLPAFYPDLWCTLACTWVSPHPANLMVTNTDSNAVAEIFEAKGSIINLFF